MPADAFNFDSPVFRHILHKHIYQSCSLGCMNKDIILKNPTSILILPFVRRRSLCCGYVKGDLTARVQICRINLPSGFSKILPHNFSNFYHACSHRCEGCQQIEWLGLSMQGLQNASDRICIVLEMERLGFKTLPMSLQACPFIHLLSDRHIRSLPHGAHIDLEACQHMNIHQGLLSIGAGFCRRKMDPAGLGASATCIPTLRFVR